MFDLFRRKDTSLRYVLGILLGLVALSMVVTLIPGFGSGGFGAGPGDESVAKVCGETVTSREVRIKMQQMLNKQSLPPESAAIFIPQFVDQFVAVKGVACYANEAGLTASDEDVAMKIQKDVPALWQEGKFVGRQMYESMLKQTGLTVAQFEDSMKKDIETQRLRTLILMSAVATPKEVEDAFRESEEKVKVEYVTIEPGLITGSIQVTDEEAKAEFEKNKASYAIPESRVVTMYLIETAKIQAGIQVTEDEMRRAYNENIDSFRQPERSHVRHILFKTKEKAESEDAKMKALADRVYKELKAGGKFEELAKKYSEDPGSKDNGGDVGFITRGQTVKNFDEYAFTGPVKALSTPIKTEFGYHIMEILEKQPAGQKSFEEVKTVISAELIRAKGSSGVGKFADDLRADLEKNPKRAAETVTKNMLGTVKFEYRAPDAPIPALGPKPEYYAAVRNLKVGEATQPSVVDANRTVIFTLDQILPKRMATFEEVKIPIQANLRIAAGNKKVIEIKNRGVELMKSVGGDFTKLAKELGLTVKQTQDFNRQGFADGIGPASSLPDVFVKKPGEMVGPVTVDGKWFFAKVLEHKAADMSLLLPRRAEIVNIVKNRKASERADVFEETLVKRMITDGSIKVNEAAKKRIAQSFGG